MKSDNPKSHQRRLNNVRARIQASNLSQSERRRQESVKSLTCLRRQRNILHKAWVLVAPPSQLGNREALANCKGLGESYGSSAGV